MEKLIKELSNKQVENVLVTALEGGSNYWYLLGEDAVLAIKQCTPEMKGEPLAIRMATALTKDAVIPIRDIEDEDSVLGEISKATIQERTKKLIEDGYLENIANVLKECDDAEDGDIIFQYWVMGEIVFG